MLNFLFLESQDGGGTATKVQPGKSLAGGEAHKPEAPGKDAKVELARERDNAESRKSELSKILGSLGLKDVAGRLEWKNGEFVLSGNKETHQQDKEVLGDISKIAPLVDKEFVVVDGEINLDGTYHYSFISGDSFYELDAEGGVSDVDLDTIDSIKPMAKEESEDLAKKLIQTALKEASGEFQPPAVGDECVADPIEEGVMLAGKITEIDQNQGLAWAKLEGFEDFCGDIPTKKDNNGRWVFDSF